MRNSTLTIIHDFANCLNDNSQTDSIFLDFSKAFDEVPHTRLCSNLPHYGIRCPHLSYGSNIIFTIEVRE